jgi:hypothetical protein
MGSPIQCSEPTCQSVRNSFLAKVCNECGRPLPGMSTGAEPASNSPRFCRLAPQADWIGPNIHNLWRKTTPLMGEEFPLNMHGLLGYSLLLRKIRDRFRELDRDHSFDACLFFLRGSYGIWGFLNQESALSLRATIFGGLCHRASHQLAFKAWLEGALNATSMVGKTQLDLLILDEVNGGGGLGNQLHCAEEVLQGWSGNPLQVHISYLAVAPSGWRRMELAKAIGKWRGPHTFAKAQLRVSFYLSVGSLITYDNDCLLGLARSRGANPYTVANREGGWVNFVCPSSGHGKCSIILAPLGEQGQAISALAGALAAAKMDERTRILGNQISLYGCPTCKVLWRQLAWPRVVARFPLNIQGRWIDRGPRAEVLNEDGGIW